MMDSQTMMTSTMTICNWLEGGWRSVWVEFGELCVMLVSMTVLPRWFADSSGFPHLVCVCVCVCVHVCMHKDPPIQGSTGFVNYSGVLRLCNEASTFPYVLQQAIKLSLML